jgi:hypothetical protein
LSTFLLPGVRNGINFSEFQELLKRIKASKGRRVTIPEE